LELEALDARLGERARSEIRLHRPPRDERDAVPGAHGAQNRLLEPELEPDPEIAESLAAAPQLVLQELTNAGTFLHRDQIPVAQLVEADGLAGETVAGRTDENHRIVEEGLEGNAAVEPHPGLGRLDPPAGTVEQLCPETL